MPSFVSASPARLARELSAAEVHVWRISYRRREGRTPLRALLAAYLDAAPDAVRFVEGAHGRPCLAPPHAGLDFNWSHSGDHALIAVARDLPTLGVDIETLRPRPRALELAKRYFAETEYRQLAQLPETSRTVAFLRLWTAKEAVLKGIGEGIRYGLHNIAFDLINESAFPTTFSGPAGPSGAWTVHAFEDAAAFACLAWRGPARTIRWLCPAPG